jgi:hypothetical protein
MKSPEDSKLRLFLNISALQRATKFMQYINTHVIFRNIKILSFDIRGTRVLNTHVGDPYRN